MFRKRIEKSANYSAIFVNSATLRIAIDETKPITELRWPEFWDIGINSLCYANCKHCYTSATNKGVNYKNIIEKINNFFGPMSLNQRPFQVALGGSGESTIHPDFIEVLKTFYNLQIIPNYTTNSMHLNDKIIEATVKYCGGIAISLYDWTKRFWERGLKMVNEAKIRTNVHLVISDKESIDKFNKYYNELNDKVEYFVLLAYMNVGFGGGKNSKQIDYKYFDKILKQLPSLSKIAFSSNFYSFLCGHPEYKTNLYEPEIMSKYLIFDDKRIDFMPSIYNNSFQCLPVDFDSQNGCIINAKY